MKKFFTLLLMSVFAVAANAITVYVQCEEAPFIWWWDADGGYAGPTDAWPGTYQFDGTWMDPNSGDTFWTYSFPAEVTKVSFLINNGAADGTKQTKDFKAITTDRYLILAWDDGEGNVSCEDITEQYIVIPDAEVNTVGISGNHNEWANDNAFTNLGNNTFTYSADIAALKTIIPPTSEVEGGVETQNWKFKFRPEGEWLGYWDFYYGEDVDPGDGRKPVSEAIDWLDQDEGNFLLDLATISEPYVTFKITWAGGKDVTKGWSLEASKGDTNGISNVQNVKASNATAYNLQGQRVNANFRGIVVKDGKKFMVK